MAILFIINKSFSYSKMIVVSALKKHLFAIYRIFYISARHRVMATDHRGMYIGFNTAQLFGNGDIKLAN
eukprot:7880493-Ditylum_brightwellii.AAC.1